MRGVGQSRDVVVLSLEPWDEVWRRNQYFVDQLRRRHPGMRVLFVEPPVDAWRSRDPRAFRPARPEPVAGEPGLWTLRPVKPLPRLAGPWSDLALRHQVRRAARRLGLGTPALWVNDVQQVGLVRATGWPATYDITDNWLVESTVPERVRRRRRRLETEALRRCDHVVVCSEGLARSRGETREVALVPNGVDVELMTAPAPRPADLPDGPVGVYVGTVHEERFDVDLLLEVLDAVPGLRVAIVGPVVVADAERQRLEGHDRLHLLGPRPHHAVPAYLQHADLVVVPHRVNDFTESLDPIKAYECLAVGTPTVATPVAGFRGLSAPVVVAPRDAYADAVARVVADPPARRPALPPDATWEGRSRVFERLLLGEEPSGRRPRVVYVGHVAQLSGGEIALARMLEAAGDAVDAHVVLAEDGPLAPRLRAAGAEVTVLPMAEDARSLRKDTVRPGGIGLGALLATVRYVVRLRREIRAIDPDLVHTNSLKAALYGGLAGRLAGRRVVWHVRDRIATDYLPRSAVWLVRRLARQVPHAIVANSRATLATVPLGGGSAARVHTAVVHDTLAGEARSLPAPDDGVLRVGVVGRLTEWKGQHVFLDAFARAFPDGREQAVVVGSAMFGEDAYAEGLRAQAERLGIGDRVDFRGFRGDVWAELARLDVLVHCSITPEPFGQVVVEGMAAGLPVVAAAAGGPAEVVTDGEDGLLVPPGDPDRLTEALRRLADDPALRARLAERAVVSAERFGPAPSTAALLDVYDAVLGSSTTAAAVRDAGGRS